MEKAIDTGKKKRPGLKKPGRWYRSVMEFTGGITE